jgi:hypothetical protein
MFDYMRKTFPFEPLTKIKERVFIFSIYIFNENLNLPKHSFLWRDIGRLGKFNNIKCR